MTVIATTVSEEEEAVLGTPNPTATVELLESTELIDMLLLLSLMASACIEYDDDDAFTVGGFVDLKALLKCAVAGLNGDECAGASDASDDSDETAGTFLVVTSVS
ncbi:hypothetical protein BSLG_003703 [Batrachochytrium salamandrivorans]|nr:hypothetical protein BSLG_003703 [Batrachochytrium salamandrivorans]